MAVNIPETEFDFRFDRSSGPGGQNVNKVASRCTLRWNVLASPSIPDAVRERFVQIFHHRINQEGELILTSQRFRDAPKNRDDCVAKLHEMIAQASYRPKARRKTRPTRGSQERRLTDKKQLSAKKQSRGRIRSDD